MCVVLCYNSARIKFYGQKNMIIIYDVKALIALSLSELASNFNSPSEFVNAIYRVANCD